MKFKYPGELYFSQISDVSSKKEYFDEICQPTLLASQLLAVSEFQFVVSISSLE